MVGDDLFTEQCEKYRNDVFFRIIFSKYIKDIVTLLPTMPAVYAVFVRSDFILSYLINSIH